MSSPPRPSIGWQSLTKIVFKPTIAGGVTSSPQNGAWLPGYIGSFTSRVFMNYTVLSDSVAPLLYIRKTCPRNVYPLEPYFYIAKIWYAGVYLFF